MAFLQLQGVSMGYGPASRRTEVLADIDLEIEEGEFVAIVGYSGSGKTTLMSILAGLLRPESGKVLFDGQDTPGPGPDRGLVFQNYSLLPWLTVYENVALAVDQVFPKLSDAERRQHTDRFVAMVNLTPARDKRPHELSGGMRQRVSVARTLSMQPKVLLLDEPLGALDALTRATLQDEISRIRLAEKQTVVLITNDPDEAILLADRVIPLTAGPRATLGPSIPVILPQPRDRRTLHQSYDFKQIRQEVIGYLLKATSRHRTTLSRSLVLPDVEPEDITHHSQRFFGSGRRARRPSELKTETVEVEL
jgi:nitrate/nitrite transport system ATP-binding protein